MGKKNDLTVLRHSAAHLLANAIKELYPDTLLTIGPATKEGFFYDVLPTRNFKESDLHVIEEKMREIAARNLPLTHEQMPKNEARKLYKDNPFKLELINEIPGDTVGISRQGKFYDLCRGGHVESTNDIKYFNLLHISGSYWRANKSNQALQRITGTAFITKEDLEAYKRHQEELQLYNHRRLGKQLDLFSFHKESAGFPFFHNKGKIIFNKLVDYLRIQQQKHGYQEIATPIMLSDELWKRSGHYTHYKDNMYFSKINEQNYAIRPMNCPGAFLIYKERPRSYRELPLRLAEFGLVHRHELSGVLHGLMRARSFTIDDAHIFCTLDQLESEILNTINLVNTVIKKFDFKNITISLSTKPDNAMVSNEVWQKATDALSSALEKAGIKYNVQKGEGAFYGPKIEFIIHDSMGREWQCGTIQIDFFQAENFDMTYVASTGNKERPVVIHRAVYGSLERFIAILLEHYKGHLPFWLAPIQIKILTITDDQKKYASKVQALLQQYDIRVIIDESSNPIAGKIKVAQLEKVPWMLVIGTKEEKNTTVTLRYADGKQEFSIPLQEFVTRAINLNSLNNTR